MNPNPKPQDISTEMEQAKALLVASKAMLENGAEIDMTALEKKIQYICATVAALPAADRGAFKLPMLALLDDMDRFYQMMQKKHAELMEQLQKLTPQKHATQAYEKNKINKPGEGNK